MNMVLIDGTEIKRKLLNCCTEVINMLVESISEFIFRKNAEINKLIGSLKEEIARTVDST